jgi:hypothetical protein
MLKTNPRRGAFDYLLDGMHDLPLWPPEGGGGGPQRIRIETEIIDRHAQLAPRPPGGALAFVLLWLLLLRLFGGLGHAQPTNRENPPAGIDQGTDQIGRHWYGSSYRLGGTAFFDACRPNGRAQEEAMAETPPDHAIDIADLLAGRITANDDFIDF